MSQISNAIFGALAISATFGAVQFASGHDLIGRMQLVSTAAETGVNRTAKADRAAIKPAPAMTQTIALRPHSMADTSVVLRVPVVKEVVKEEARNHPVVTPPTKRGPTKVAVACEPPVSVLTEVAKLLEPGRCVT
jgi:hypothetical protein